jgi:hypothetical protein
VEIEMSNAILETPVPFAPAAWPAGEWNLPVDNAKFQRDGAAAFALFKFRFNGWKPTPAAPPDVDSLLPVIGRHLEQSPAWQAFNRSRCDFAAAERAARVAHRDLQAADVAAVTARIDLRGEALALELASIDRQRDAGLERLRALEQGLVHLRADLDTARAKADHAVYAAVAVARDEAGPKLRSRAEILAAIAEAVAPLLDELGSWTLTSDPSVIVAAARREFLANEPREAVGAVTEEAANAACLVVGVGEQAK